MWASYAEHWGCAWASWGAHVAEAFPVGHRWASGGSLGHSRICVPIMACGSAVCLSPRLFPPPDIWLTMQSSGWGKITMSPLGSVQHNWGKKCSLIHSFFALQERNHRPRRSLLALCCVPGGRGNAGSQTILIHSNVYILVIFFFFLFLLQQYARTSPLETQTSTRALILFSEAPELQPRGTEAGSQDTAVSTVRTKVCLPVTQCTGG